MKKIFIIAVSLIAALSFTACNKNEKKETATEKPTAQAVEKVTEKTGEEAAKPVVNLAVSEEEMGGYIDTAENSYASFELIPIDSPDFFIGKNLRLAALIADHKLTMLYSTNAKAEFTHDTLVMDVPDQSEGFVKNEFLVYKVADSVKKSPEGKDFSYVAYGKEKISSENTEGAIGVLSLIKVREDVNMGDAAADSYVMLLETSAPETYYIFKIEE